MNSIAISEFRAHMSKYLLAVNRGEIVVLTSHGKAVAEIKRPSERVDDARARLAAIASTAKLGDITTPAIDAFGAA